MDDYIVTVDDGRFVLSVRRLVRVAVFEEDADARAAAEFFAARDADDAEPDPAPRPGTAGEGVTETPNAELPTAVPVQPLTDWGEARLEVAFKRIAAGEKLSDVARDMGGDWRVLRSRWAVHKREMNSASTDQQPCSICERPFTPSMSSPDKCARCARD